MAQYNGVDIDLLADPYDTLSAFESFMEDYHENDDAEDEEETLKRWGF